MQAVKRKKFNGQEACADNLALTPLPNSQKVYVTGKTPDVRVPMRRIDQSPTVLNGTTRVNPPFMYMTPPAPIPTKMRILTFVGDCRVCVLNG